MTLDNFRAHTRYPLDARPLEEMPDLQEPFAGAPQQLAVDGGGQIEISQDRFVLVGDEAAHVFVTCRHAGDGDPCTFGITELRTLGATPLVATVSFDDRGVRGDAQAGDGVFTATVAPKALGLGDRNAALEVAIEVSAGAALQRTAVSLFYSPAPPARFTGKVREVIEHGSLALYVGVEVERAGRYLMGMRVEDDSQAGFAYLSFADELAKGSVEARFELFGKLVLDGPQNGPFVRDLEGFVLLEDQDPDRISMATLFGAFHRTEPYGSNRFSADEWQHEYRTRHLEEYERAVREAQAAVDAQGG